MPTAGFTDHAIVPVAPVRVALNCWLWEVCKEAAVGAALNDGGTRLTVAVAVRPAPLTVTVTFCCEVMDAGAV